MATIVLSAAGAVLGGPIGAAVGAVIGQQIDAVIFAPKARQGPRLGDLAIQTSSYGSAIPKLFGTVRVSGSVIWATDLIEARLSRSNGKGRGATDIYSYSASFAVALSGRPIAAIGRIWADGKLLRGAAGDFKSETGFRVYLGGENQALDPLIAASEGIGATPAYRGLAYAVFENMALASFGNRIPSLSFEVVAEAAGTTAGAVLKGLSTLESDNGPSFVGLAVTGDSVRGVAEAIGQAVPFSVIVEDGVLKARFGAGPVSAIVANDRGASAGTRSPAVTTERMAAAAIPEIVTIAYNDVARDYLIGAQRARRDGGARREIRVELPAAIGASAAKAIAEARLTKMWAERSRATITLPWRALTVNPGNIVTVPGLSGRWRVARVTLEAMVVRLDLILTTPASTMLPVADAGRNRSQIDVPQGPTTMQIVDLPQLGDVPETAAFVGVLANGASGGWRRATLMTSGDAGASYLEAGSTALPAVIGKTTSVLEGSGCALIDMNGSVDVQLVHPGLTLADADDAALLSGANLAMVGDEALQFGRAMPLGNGKWRLSNLWRGRRGTEWAAVVHPLDTPFALIEADAVARVNVAAAAAGGRVMAVGVGDTAGVMANAPPETGAATRALAPVNVRFAPNVGGVQVEWTRRSRDGWRWSDAIDAPIAEEGERYRVMKTATGRPDLTAEVLNPWWLYTSAERSADAAAGASLALVSIAQIGTFGISRTASIAVATT